MLSSVGKAFYHPPDFKQTHPGTIAKLKAKANRQLQKPDRNPPIPVEHLTKARLSSILSSNTQSLEGQKTPSSYNKFNPTAPEEPAEPTELSNTVRLLMRSVPHSVVVVTAARLGPYEKGDNNRVTKPNTPKDYRGMTVSSFTTITLSPYPIISFNAKIPSKTLEAINESRNFLIHILEASEDGMKIADAFTKGSRHVTTLLSDRERGFGIKKVEIMTGTGTKFVMPQLHEKSVMRVLRCALLEEEEGGLISGLLRVGDHVLVVARVEEVLLGEWGRKKGGLCYADGEYRRVGDIIGGETGG